VSQLRSNLLYTPKERFIFKPSHRVFDTGIKISPGKLYYASSSGYWMDLWIPTTGSGWLIPDILTNPFVSFYEKIFSRRRADPRVRVCSLMYRLKGTGIKGYIGDENYIYLPKEFNHDVELSLYVNDYSSKWNYKNNFGKLTVTLSEVGYDENKFLPL